MSRWSPNVVPVSNGLSSALDDLAGAAGTISAARSIRERTNLQKKELADREAQTKADQDWRTSQGQYQHGQDALAEQERQAELGTRGIVRQGQAGTTAPIQQGGRGLFAPNLTGTGPAEQLTSFTPNAGAREIGGGYYYDPGHDIAHQQTLEAREYPETVKAADRARATAALTGGGYTQGDAGLVVNAGVNPDTLGPLAADADKRKVDVFRKTQLQEALVREAGETARAGGRMGPNGMTPYQSAELGLQTATHNEQQDTNDLKLAEDTWNNKDPILGKPRTPADSVLSQRADSIRGAVSQRRAGVAPYNNYLPMFGGPGAQLQPAAPTMPRGRGPVTGGAPIPPGTNFTGGQPRAGGAQGRLSPQERASQLYQQGVKGDQLRRQLIAEGYAVK